jgi:hypothetical protein
VSAATDIRNVINVGSGPAGYTADLHTARASPEPLVLQGGLLDELGVPAQHWPQGADVVSKASWDCLLVQGEDSAQASVLLPQPAMLRRPFATCTVRPTSDPAVGRTPATNSAGGQPALGGQEAFVLARLGDLGEPQRQFASGPDSWPRKTGRRPWPGGS